MAQTINQARSVAARRSIGGYHWALLALTIVVSVVIAIPTLWSQPPIYDTTATIKIDSTRYNSYINDATVQKEVNEIALEATRQELAQRGLTGFGSARFGVEISLPAADGTITITSHALSADAAQQSADLAADRTMRSIRATGGRDLLRRLMDAEQYRMWQSLPAADAFSTSIRQIIAFGAFDIPHRATPTAPALNDEDYADLARALEVRYDQLTWQLNDPRSTLTPLQRRDLQVARASLQTFLNQPYPLFQFTGTQPSAAYVAALAALPIKPRSQHLALKLGLVLLVGTVGGMLLVFVDRAIGIVPKLRELWSYRELIRNLVLRDLKARYKSSVLGYFWSLLNPLLMIVLFYFVFRVLLGSSIADFHIFLMVALLPWNYFANALSEGMNSVVGNSNLVKKVYFPREILPITALLANLINFLLSLPVLFFVIIITGGSVALTALLLPVIIVIESIFILGMVLLFSSLTVFYRDTTHIMGVILQLWFFVTPIFYPLEQIGRPMFTRLVRWLNPMASLIDFYRDILYGGLALVPNQPTPGLPALDGIARTAVTCIIVLAIGAYVFHRQSGRFGEEL